MRKHCVEFSVEFCFFVLVQLASCVLHGSKLGFSSRKLVHEQLGGCCHHACWCVVPSASLCYSGIKPRQVQRASECFRTGASISSRCGIGQAFCASKTSGKSNSKLGANPMHQVTNQTPHTSTNILANIVAKFAPHCVAHAITHISANATPN